MSARPDGDGATVEKAAGFVVSGVVRYDDGRAPPPKCEFDLCSLDGARSVHVKAVDGRFQAKLDRPGRCISTWVRAEASACEGRLLVDLAEPGVVLELVLAAPRPVTLRVIGADTGEPIVGVCAWPEMIGSLDGRHPWQFTPTGDPVYGDREGFVSLAPATGTQGWWLVAPGRAWTPARVSFDVGPTITVAMAAGGDLDVTVAHAERAPGTVLYWRGADKGYERLPDLGSSTHFLVHGVPAGDGVIEAYVDDDEDTPACVPSAVTIRTDAIAKVSVDFERPATRAPAVRSAGVTGTVEVSEGWGDQTPLVVIGPVEWRARDRTSPRVWRVPSDPPRRFRFESGPQPLGPCALFVVFLPPGPHPHTSGDTVFTKGLELTPAGTALDVRVPPPSEVRVRVVDATTGEPIVGAVYWTSWPQRIDGFTYTGQDPSRYDYAAHTWRIPVVPGSYHVIAHVNGYVDVGEDVEIVPGRDAECTLRLPRHLAAMLVVRLQIDGRPALVDAVMMACAHGEHSTRERTSRGQAIFSDLDPGPATITFEEFTGFVTPTPIPLELKAGETKDVVVELKRAD